LSYAELRLTLGNEDMASVTLTGHVSRLQSLLRRELGSLVESFPEDPIECEDRMGYRLNLW
jgi:hypothetical protein